VTSALFVVLFFLLLLSPVSFVNDMGMQPSVATSVLAKRASMFMLGLSILLFCSRNLPHSNARQVICLSTGITMIGLACSGIYEHFMGTVNSSIFISIIIETILGLSFLIIYFKGQK
jgi:peptidoglycan/LPS O-acetylase OafA/YrhL